MPETKNPYEIRLDILNMSKDLLVEKWNSTNYALQEHYNAKTQRAMETESELPAPYEPLSFPSEDDIISKARQLNEFVSNG
tara:strand:- start:35417 stop:35659 length:243 start_codon:yes stop_codon:yes gene_type:complete